MDERLREKERQWREQGTDASHLAYLLDHDRTHGTQRAAIERPDLYIGDFVDAVNNRAAAFREGLIAMCEAYEGDKLVLASREFQYGRDILALEEYFMKQGTLHLLWRSYGINSMPVLKEETPDLRQYVESLQLGPLVAVASRVREQVEKIQ